MTRRYRIEHRTTYDYDAEVTDSYGLAHVRPRDLPWQDCLSHEVTTDPDGADLAEHVDAYGNTATYLHVTTPHTRLVVTSTALVVARDREVVDGGGVGWERARPAERRDAPDAWSAVDFTAPSPLVDVDASVAAYARDSFGPGRPLVEAVLDLSHRIHRDVEYRPGATSVSTRVPDVLAGRGGVCQDFAHLTVACLRSLGLAGRYVSGYLATDPPPGRDRVVGADATHAWASVWVPGVDGARGGWLAVDPTNDQVVQTRHVTVAYGRDYADVPPLKGVIFSEATTSSMSVTVDVAPLEP